MEDQAKPAKTVEVKLDQPHTHQGKEHAKDEKIQVLPHTADYIEKNSIGKRTGA